MTAGAVGVAVGHLDLPCVVTLLLTRVSGIPMLEARAEERWGNEEEFQSYSRNTPVIPRPPRAS